MGDNPQINELTRIDSATAHVTAGGATEADIDIPQGVSVILAWGHSTDSDDDSRVSVRLVQDGANDRQTIEVSEQGGNNAATISITAFSPR